MCHSEWHETSSYSALNPAGPSERRKGVCSSVGGGGGWRAGCSFAQRLLPEGKAEHQSIARMAVLTVALASWELGSAINLKRGTVCTKVPAHISDTRGSDAFLLCSRKTSRPWGNTSQPGSKFMSS